MHDPYELLGLDRLADAAQVKRAYRRLAKRYHPDATRDDGRAFLALRIAYETLMDPDRRSTWDRRHPGSGVGRSPARRRPERPDGRGTHGPGPRAGDGATPEDGADGVHGPGPRHRARDPRGRFMRADAAPWWEEIRGTRSVGADLPGSRGDPHLGPSSSGAAWSSAARAYLRRLTRQDSAARGKQRG